LLLVENDLYTGKDLFRTLSDAQYCVDWVRDGRAARVAIDAESYAVVLLNHALPDICGIEMLKVSRAAGSKVPVLLMSARNDPDLHVRGLDVGADDCVTKPFDVREVLARIRAVLRRSAGYATSRIGDNSLGLDLDKRTLWVDGVESPLSAREFSLMHAFMGRRGGILSRSQLEERLYGWGREVESNSVDVLIHGMRKKFGQSLIRNVRGLGWTVAPQSCHSSAGLQRKAARSQLLRQPDVVNIIREN
jgi:two-component system OmpR family response regulator